MRNVWAVATRELRSYFLSPLAYVVIALFLFAAGLAVRADPANRPRGIAARADLRTSACCSCSSCPTISMRLLAEEQRTGTIELLLTNPVQEWEIVTGKFLASRAAGRGHARA